MNPNQPITPRIANAQASLNTVNHTLAEHYNKSSGRQVKSVGAAAAIIGGALSFLGPLIGTWYQNRQNKKLAEQQNDWSKQQVQDQNNYNTPLAQASRLQAMGYTDAQIREMFYGDPSTGLQTSVATPANIAGTVGDPFTNALTSGSQALLTSQQAKGQMLDNQLSDATMQSQIEQCNQNYVNSVYDGLLKDKQGNLYDAQTFAQNLANDWQQTLHYYQEQGIKLENIQQLVDYRYMVLEIISDPEYMAFYGNTYGKGNSRYFDADIPAFDKRHLYSISPDAFSQLSEQDKKDYNYDEGTNRYVKEYNAHTRDVQACEVISNAAKSWYIQSKCSLMQDNYDAKTLENQASTQQREFELFLSKLDNEERNAIITGNISKMREKMYSSSDGDKFKWWQYAIMVAGELANSGIGLGTMLPKFRFSTSRIRDGLSSAKQRRWEKSYRNSGNYTPYGTEPDWFR